MDGLEAVRAEYDRLDRMLGIDTSGILLSCSARMASGSKMSQYFAESVMNVSQPTMNSHLLSSESTS